MTGAAGVVVERDALAALYARAGASDEDRIAWLQERLGGVTATQVRELKLQGAGYRHRLLNEKARGILEAWVNSRYTAWGNKREPIIAAWAQSRFAIVPEKRVFHAADNARFLVSPDGVGVDFNGDLVVSEIKTGKDDIAPGTEAFERKGYGLQCQWSMRVTGARRCKYIWEQHDSDWQDRGGEHLEPMPLHAEPFAEWIEYDEAIAAELETIALDFLADLDELVRELADGALPEIDDTLDTHAVNYLRFHGLEKEATEAKKTEWVAMLERLEGCDALSQEGATARVTYNPGEAKTSTVPDVQAAKDGDPDLFAEVEALAKRWNDHQANFTKTSVTPAKPNLTVTAIKTKESKK